MSKRSSFARFKTTASLLIIALCAMLASCNSSAESVCNHVLFVYMGGDNDLSGETYQKIAALKQGFSGSTAHKLVIYQDPANATPSLIELVKENGKIVEKLIISYPEENSADPDVFAAINSDVKRLYPASSYGLLVFSHASGWLPTGTLTTPRTIIIDGKSEMSIVDFARAIPANMYHYIVLEACFTAGIEVAYELKDKTNYILGSSAEIVSPGFTSIYSNPAAVNFLLQGNIVDFMQMAYSHIDGLSGWSRSATFSVIVTSELDALAGFIAQHADRSKEVDVSKVQHFDRYSDYRLFFDFEDYYARLIDESQLPVLSRLVANCVKDKAATESFMVGYNGFSIHHHAGLTTYIPQARFPFLNEAYLKLAWGQRVVAPVTYLAGSTSIQ